MEFVDWNRIVFAVGCGLAVILICGGSRRSLGLGLLSFVLAWSFTTLAVMLTVGVLTLFFASHHCLCCLQKNMGGTEIIDSRIIDVVPHPREREDR